MPDTLDVLLVGVGSTPGLRRADEALARALRRAGASVAIVQAARPREVRTLMLTDLHWAWAARRAAREALGRGDGLAPRAVIYSSTTAALFWPRVGAIRFDAPAAANRPGRHGLWQRPLERRRLRQAPLLLPWSEGGLAEACAAVPGSADRALILPAPIELDDDAGADRTTRVGEAGAAAGGGGPVAAPERDVAALTYAGNPCKKGFDRVLAAWRRACRPPEELLVVGIGREGLRRAGFELPGHGVRALGSLSGEELRELLHRTRVLLCAPRREDYGLIQLEALAAGCQVVTTPAPGAYAALAIAHQLDPRLVSEDLATALRDALDAPLAGYSARAARLIEPFGVAAVDRLVAENLLPRLLQSETISAN
ncbi:MAG TPA: glycosyltransferase [Solirubrobacteraceae bacterium]|nr:glycosyltransferase [Solirubrobacteraceae bacterium]